MNLKYWKTNKARARALCTFWPLSAFTKSRFQRSRDVPATGNYLFWGCYNCYLPSTGLKHWKTNKARARALCTFDLCTFALSPPRHPPPSRRLKMSPGWHGGNLAFNSTSVRWRNVCKRVDSEGKIFIYLFSLLKHPSSHRISFTWRNWVVCNFVKPALLDLVENCQMCEEGREINHRMSSHNYPSGRKVGLRDHAFRPAAQGNWLPSSRLLCCYYFPLPSSATNICFRKSTFYKCI